mmetsp:Transcript_5931/g.13492  ORF Transcript_5931/g.13492 Transcript_5931/m.13492 type:complete len:213 (-) Transcript_5931:121-759(-)
MQTQLVTCSSPLIIAWLSTFQFQQTVSTNLALSLCRFRSRRHSGQFPLATFAVACPTQHCTPSVPKRAWTYVGEARLFHYCEHSTLSRYWIYVLLQFLTWLSRDEFWLSLDHQRACSFHLAYLVVNVPFPGLVHENLALSASKAIPSYAIIPHLKRVPLHFWYCIPFAATRPPYIDSVPPLNAPSPLRTRCAHHSVVLPVHPLSLSPRIVGS